MHRNLTIRLDEKTIRRAKVIAAQRGTSVSRLLAQLVERMTDEAREYDAARRRALEYLDRGFQLGGTPLDREEIYDR